MTQNDCNHYIVEPNGEWWFAGVATPDSDLLLCAMCGQRFKPRSLDESRILFRARWGEAVGSIYDALPAFVKRWLR